MKKEIKIKPFWYSDIWLFPKLITIITTLDKEGNVNAGPYSHIMQYDVMTKNPRMIVGFRQDSHSFVNICDTGEFVINCPSASHLDDMMETAKFYPEGVNELEFTKFTQIPSLKVKPPSLKECPQIAECTVDEIVKLEKSTGIVIATIQAIVVDEELETMGREERIRTMNLPIGMGDEARQEYYHATVGELTKHRLGQPKNAMQGADAVTHMEWDKEAMKMLMNVPPPLRKMVIQSTEEHAVKKKEAVVTSEVFTELAKSVGMDPEVMERFRSGG